MNKKIILTAFALSHGIPITYQYAVASESASTTQETEIKNFLNKVGGDIVSLLTNRSTSQENKKTEIRKLVNEKFDVQYIQKRSVARVLSMSNADDQLSSEIKKLVINYLITKYINFMADYKDVTFQINSVQELKNQGQWKATCTAGTDKGDKVNITVYLTKKGNYFLVQNMIFGSVDITSPGSFMQLFTKNGKDINKFKDALQSLI